MGFKVKLRKTDTMFSNYIRGKAHWRCEYCHKYYGDNKRGLHNSHYWSRGRESTRFEPDNCVAFCYYHHEKLGHGDGRDEYREFMVKRLGQNRFDSLMIQSNTTKKRDDKMDEIVIKELLKTLDSEDTE